jgi:hypothetical protein
LGVFKKKEKEKMNKIIQKIKNIFQPMQQNSDGYHTFNELYRHRYALFIALCRREPSCWKSKEHSDGTMFDGEFVCGFETKDGPITYHLPLEMWTLCDFIKTIPSAPEWDGHTSEDVINRLRG